MTATMSMTKEQSQVEEVTVSISPSPISMDSFKPTFRFWLVFLAFAVLTLMVAIDSTSLSVALSIVAQKLHGTAIEAFWAGTSFLLASTVLVNSSFLTLQPNH